MRLSVASGSSTCPHESLLREANTCARSCPQLSPSVAATALGRAAAARMRAAEARRVLEVGTHASQDEIRKAYRQAALRWHPDKNPGNSEAATMRFRQVHAAYLTLQERSPDEATHADGNARNGNDGMPTFEDSLRAFHNIFGTPQPRAHSVPRRSQDHSPECLGRPRPSDPRTHQERLPSRRARPSTARRGRRARPRARRAGQRATRAKRCSERPRRSWTL